MSKLYSWSNSRTILSRSGNGCGSHPTQLMVDKLLQKSILLAEDWQALDPHVRDKIQTSEGEDEFLGLLVKHNLLTPYQAARLSAGTTFGLLLGSYRVLDRLGAGGMAVVFKAEHID